MRVRIVSEAFDPERELTAFAADSRAGACASFIGLCRGEGAQGPVSALELQHYPGFTEREIARIGEAVQARFALIDLLIVHRVGRVAPGESIVLAAALSAHRAEAMAALEQAMDYLKTDAPFWKREIGPSQARWVEPTPEDRRRRARHER
jgi:molybdopterin synthase catalytic subunit